MKLLRTYSDDASMHGYLDPISGILYHVETATAWLTETGRPSRVAASTADAIHFLSPPFYSEAEALAELDRIAALISGEAAPVGQGWVEGPPPLTRGAWFNVLDEDRNIHAVQCVYPESSLPWETAAAHPHASSDFTHHLPTPIQLPKETDE